MIAEATGPVRLPIPTHAVEGELRSAWETLGFGPAEPGLLDGQLLRPRLGAAVAAGDRPEGVGGAIWLALLAVQLAHEASLLHDDVVDGSLTRRGRPTLLGRRGIGAALVAGDQLLSRAYLAAAATASWDFVHSFARAVDATIAGEREQGRVIGERIDASAMREIARGKSGALFGCALAASATLERSPSASRRALLGQEIGILYQRVDDLLDFCANAETGKPPLADHRAGVWTWPRLLLGTEDAPSELFADRPEGIPALRALATLEAEADALVGRIRRELSVASELTDPIQRWIDRARGAVRRELEIAPPPVRAMRGPRSGYPLFDGAQPRWTPSIADPEAILGRHGRSFHFASRLLAPDIRDPVTRVYAFCRALDDAVDLAPEAQSAGAALDRLLGEARYAYEAVEATHRPTSKPVGTIARAMLEMRSAGIPFDLVEDLGEGIRMDLTPRRFPDFESLGTYTHRVAGVVGLWVAGLAGCRDPWALRLADELGRAMQLTNIARDVGEDLSMGRLYLPLDLLDRHRLREEALMEIRGGSDPIPAEFAAALEEVMGRADAGYGAAIHAVPYLPDGYRRAVAVAARVYQGIHAEIRRNGFDTLRRRARTGFTRKVVLGVSSLRELARAEGLARR